MTNELRQNNSIKLSIVIPTYNKSRFLPLLLESLLEQDYPKNNMEIIVVNDGSTDNTSQIIEKFDRRFEFFIGISQPNKGISASRNVGARASSGEFIAFLADDYILSPSYCSALIATFNDPAVTAVRSYPGSVGKTSLELLELYQIRLYIWRHLYDINQTSLFRFGDLPLPINTEPLTGIISWSGAAMMRRSIFEKFGYFDESLAAGEDTEYAYRLAVNANIKMHFYPAVLFYIHFRTGFLDYMKRCYEYAYNGTMVFKVYRQHAMGMTRAGRLYQQLLIMRLVLLQNDNLARAVMMAPYLLCTRIVARIGRLRG